MQRSVNSTVTTFTSVVAQNDPRPFEKHTRSIKDQLWHAGHALSENSDQAKDKLSLWRGVRSSCPPAQLSFTTNIAEHGPDPSLTFHQLHTSHHYRTVSSWLRSIWYQIYEISCPEGNLGLKKKLPWVIWGPLSASWCLFCAAWCRHSSRGCEWTRAWRFSSSWGAEAHRCLLGEETEAGWSHSVVLFLLKVYF